MDSSNYDVLCRKINGKEYIADTEADRIISALSRNNIVLSMRFGKEGWKDKKGYFCVPTIFEEDSGNIIDGIKIHCINIEGYDYIYRKEFERVLCNYFLKGY